MPITGIEQPEIIPVDDRIRLRKYDGKHSFALAWYQDAEMVYLVDGVREPYTEEKLERMYAWLAARGELYWIDVFRDDRWNPVGDVTFWPEDMPIVIGEAAYRGQGLGRKVIAALIARGRMLGCKRLRVAEIYDWNEPSRRCFESAGFRAEDKTEHGSSFVMELQG